MKQQTFISIWKDKDNNVVNFERWSDKRLSTIIRKLIKLHTYPIYRNDKKTVKIEIYDTPNGKDKTTPMEILNFEFILKEAKKLEQIENKKIEQLRKMNNF